MVSRWKVFGLTQGQGKVSACILRVLTGPIHAVTQTHITLDTHAGVNAHMYTGQPSLMSCVIQMTFVFISWKKNPQCPQQLKVSVNLT